MELALFIDLFSVMFGKNKIKGGEHSRVAWENYIRGSERDTGVRCQVSGG